MKEKRTYAFEGLDGAGKTTNTLRLAEELSVLGFSVVVVSNPSRQLVGNILRRNIGNMTSSLRERRFIYDLKRTNRSIDPGAQIVIWDRHAGSIYASNPDSNQENIEKSIQSIPAPDLIFFLDIPPEISWEREGKTSDHLLSFDWVLEKYKRYKDLYSQDSPNVVKVDALQSLDAVFKDIITIVLADLSKFTEDE